MAAFDVVGQVIDAGQAAPPGIGRGQPEIDVVQRMLAEALDQVQAGAADAPDRRQVQFHRPGAVRNALGAELERAPVGIGGIADPEGKGAHRRAVQAGEVGAETGRFGIDDEMDITLLPQRDALGAVQAGTDEAQLGEQRFQRRGLGGDEFDELETVGSHRIEGVCHAYCLLVCSRSGWRESGAAGAAQPSRASRHQAAKSSSSWSKLSMTNRSFCMCQMS